MSDFVDTIPDFTTSILLRSNWGNLWKVELFPIFALFNYFLNLQFKLFPDWENRTISAYLFLYLLTLITSKNTFSFDSNSY